MKAKYNALLILALITITAACNRQASDNDAVDYAWQAEADSDNSGFSSDGIDGLMDKAKSDIKFGATYQANLNDGESTDDRQLTADKIIRTADIGMRMANYEQDKHAIFDVIKSHKAYISREDERKETYRISNDLQIRVPNDKFDELIKALTTGNGIQNIDYKRVNALDVGEEFNDIITRLKTKKEVERQYISVLKQARTIPDILAVKEKIRQLREEIEANEGRMRYLSDRIQFSTINLNVYQTLESGDIIERPGFLNKFKNALQNGWNGLLSFLLVIVNLWPFWVLLIGLIYLFRKLKWRPFRRKGKSA